MLLLKYSKVTAMVHGQVILLSQLMFSYTPGRGKIVLRNLNNAIN